MSVEDFGKLYEELNEFEGLDKQYEELNNDTIHKIIKFAKANLSEFCSVGDED